MKSRAMLALLISTGCDSIPVTVPNDTAHKVRMDIHDRTFPTPVQLEDIVPGSSFGNRYCWDKSDAILLVTQQVPDPIVLDPKDFCDPDECDCEIPVSRLVNRLTPSFVLKRQRDICRGEGPFLQPEIRTELCAAYVARSTGDKPTGLFSWESEAMLDR